eukprot:GGOE01019071.1.p2 GENE.GGOE01019071.1~~GGOE01019071.1.p2  ORF type:complete len:182 (-),score=72.89 GGOE01019071.1:567-1091(-)
MSGLPLPRQPNVLVTGTPGVGKTTFAAMLAEETSFTHVNVGDLIKERGLHDGWNADFDCFDLNEDKVCDEMEPMMVEGRKIVDFHTCDFFPERWFHLVVVLRASTTQIYDRLTARGYSEKKRTENVEAEIMNVVIDEAREGYRAEVVLELPSNTTEEMEANVERVKHLLEQMLR